MLLPNFQSSLVMSYEFGAILANNGIRDSLS